MIPIVGILLATDADPLLKDENGFSVEDWAKIEMYDGLVEVLALIRHHATQSASLQSTPPEGTA